MKIKRLGLQSGVQIFKVLSDESRVRIINLLLTYDSLCMSDIEVVLEFSQTKTSRHLAYLRRSGAVSFRQVELWKFYFVKEELRDLFSGFVSRLGQDAQLQRDRDTYKVMLSNRELAVSHINMIGHQMENYIR